MSFIKNKPHRRFDQLRGEWILVSPHRTDRPWQGGQERSARSDRPAYDPACYLCPGNSRANGEVNPDYEGVYVFENDFAALLPEPAALDPWGGGLLNAEMVNGTCRVICFSPRHDLTLASMEPPAIERVIDLWAEQSDELGRRYEWVQVFENKGEIMGCSNPHPHGQIWASSKLPNEPAKEDARQKEYAEKSGGPLLIDYVGIETAERERIVVENEHWVAVVPFWATWPFETLLVPRRHVLGITGLRSDERSSLALILRRLLGAYDHLFSVSFPYTMGWHAAPFVKGDVSHWQLHAHFYPPLLRSATIRKFMVGYEMLAEPQRDITPEAAAERLRESADTLG